MLPKLGRYETLRKIASGGMATVYLGRVVGEGGFERLVALKVMHPHIASDPDFVGMFLDEARLAAKIRHPNVVATIDVQKTKDAMFLVMDYVDGPTLQEMRKHLKTREERLPIGICLRFFIDILNGLQEAHDLRDKDGKPLNLVHRDVSPHNILVGQDGRAQLTDFGVAKAEARISSTRGGQLKGKIAYMPPEQIIAQPVDRRADVYSAGVCMWEALVGKRLFRAANDGALVHMILEGNPSPPSKYCDDIPAALEGVLMKAISRKVEDRYDEAVDFAEALEDAAREAKIKIPRQRAVGQFIKEIVGEIGRQPVSKRSLTPPSAPSQGGPTSSPSVQSAPSGVSAPSMPSMGTGPSHPLRPPVQNKPPLPAGPPRIPALSSDHELPVAGAPQVAAGKSQPLVGKPLQFDIVDEPPVNAPPINPGGPIPVASHPSGGVPTAGVPSAPAASPPRPTGQIPPRRMPKPNFDIDDPPTDVILPDQDMVDLVNSSQPSVVTSPTQTEAVYSLVPPPNRHGVIAVGVAGAILVVILLAVFVGQPDTETENLADPAAPLPTFEESADPFALPPPPDPSDEPSPAPSSTTPEPETSGVKPTPFPLPRPGRRGLPRPKPKPDEPFKPKTL